MIKRITEKQDWNNVIVKTDKDGKDGECYICRLKIKSPLKVYYKTKQTRNAHLSCMLKRIEEEMFSHNSRMENLNKMKVQILTHPKELKEDKNMVIKQKIIKELK